MENWNFSWISEPFNHDSDAFFAKTNHKSLYNHTIDNFNFTKPEPTQTPEVSGVSTLDVETGPRRPRSIIQASTKPKKRKSRASKKTQTTFIAADPANFRRMVQQVTGDGSIGNWQKPVPQVSESEVEGSGDRNRGVASLMPTLDTSAFLLDGAGGAGLAPTTTVDGGAGSLDFNGFSSFPTLDSWEILRF